MSEIKSQLSSESMIELHAYLKQLVSPEELAAVSNPSFARVEAYWHIGRIIVETEQQGEQRADYGTQLIENLSEELTATFGKGYKSTNLWWFRQFYVEYPIPHATRDQSEFDLKDRLRTELTWTHYRLLIAIDNKQERAFYMNAAADEGWSYRTLQKLVRSNYYYQVGLEENQFRKDTLKKKALNEADHIRSKIGKTKQILLAQSGWALINKLSLSYTFETPKPELLFYNYLLGRIVCVWFRDSSPNLLAFLPQQLENLHRQQPTQVSAPPVGLLVSAKNDVQVIQVTESVMLTAAERSLLPKKIEE